LVAGQASWLGPGNNGGQWHQLVVEGREPIQGRGPRGQVWCWGQVDGELVLLAEGLWQVGMGLLGRLGDRGPSEGTQRFARLGGGCPGAERPNSPTGKGESGWEKRSVVLVG